MQTHAQIMQIAAQLQFVLQFCESVFIAYIKILFKADMIAVVIFQ
jgi:hypothetical protein